MCISFIPKELITDCCSEMMGDHQNRLLEFVILDWQSLDD